MANGIDGAFGVLYGEVDALGGILGHFYVGEHFLDFVLNTVHVDVAHHDYTLKVGTIPFFIVVAECLMGEVVHHFHSAYGQTVTVDVVGVNFRKQVGEYAHLTHIGGAPFLMDYGTLGIDFLGEEEKVVGPVVENEQAGVLNALAHHRHIVDVVDGHVDACSCVEVLAEFHSH